MNKLYGSIKLMESLPLVQFMFISNKKYSTRKISLQEVVNLKASTQECCIFKHKRKIPDKIKNNKFSFKYDGT